jgi:hypothetical protein
MIQICTQFALDMLYLTSRIYLIQSSNTDDLLKEYFVTVIDDNNLRVGITVNHTDKRICVVFRGSCNLNSWYYNLNSNALDIRNGICLHNGFCNQLFETNLYFRICNLIRSTIRDFPEYDIVISGHSSGGAIGTILGYLLSFELPEQHIYIISFGSPRVGNYEFKKDFESRTNLTHYRIVNTNDIIAQFPIYNYTHVGTDIYLHSDSYIHNYFFTHWDHYQYAYYMNAISLNTPLNNCICKPSHISNADFHDIKN